MAKVAHDVDWKDQVYKMFSPQEDPTGQKYGRLEEEGGMGPDKVASNIIKSFISKHFTLLLYFFFRYPLSLNETFLLLYFPPSS